MTSEDPDAASAEGYSISEASAQPPAAQGVAATERRTQQPPEPVDPQQSLIEGLQQMFSTLDKETIQDVLVSNNGNADAAVPHLLELSGGQAPGTPVYSEQSAQMAADEAYARRLMAEEHEASVRYGGQLRYQPRQHRPGAPPGAALSTGGATADLGEQNGRSSTAGREQKDELQDALNTVKEAAGTAGRVAQTWFNKASAFAKEKYSDYEQQRAQKAAAAQAVDSNQNESAPFKLPSSDADKLAKPSSNASRTSSSLPHGNRYAKASTTSTYAQAPPMTSKPDAATRQRISLVDNARERTAEDSDEEENFEYTRSPFDEE